MAFIVMIHKDFRILHPEHYCVQNGICLLWDARDVKAIRSLAAWKKHKQMTPYRRDARR